jgi:hypothetical protein
MADEIPANRTVTAAAPAPAVKPGPGPGSDLVPVWGIVLLTAYLAAFIGICLYGLIVFWPTPKPGGPKSPEDTKTNQQIDSTTGTAKNASPSPASSPTTTNPNDEPSPGTTPATAGKVQAFGREFKIWDEVRLLWIVILAGALGSLIHAVRSVYWYVGNRNLVRSWLAKYLVMPFTGSALAVMFYFVVRGGFFSPQSDFSQTSPFGFAALSAMVGLFSEQAVLKLKQVAETILAKPESGADPMPPQQERPVGADDSSRPDPGQS